MWNPVSHCTAWFCPILEACFTGWKSLSYMVFLHISPCTSPQSSSLHHAMECDAETSISSAASGLSFALMGENYARESFRPPEQPKTWRLQRQFKDNSTFISVYCCITSVWVERSTIGKVAVSSWRYWRVCVYFSPFRSANLSSFGEILSSADSETKLDLLFSLIRKHDSHGPMLWHWSRYWRLINNMIGICQKNLL